MSNGWDGEWRWTEHPLFVEDCKELDVDPGEVDWLRGVIADSILENPIAGSVEAYEPYDSRYDPNVRYFRTLDSPGLNHLEPRLIVFRVEPVPESGSVRLLTGLALWNDPDA